MNNAGNGNDDYDERYTLVLPSRGNGGIGYMITFANQSLGNVFLASVNFMRDRNAETVALNLDDNDPVLHSHARAFILLGRNFCAMWGQGAVLLDIRYAWWTAEDLLGLPRTVFNNRALNIEDFQRSRPRPDHPYNPRNTGGGNGGGGPPNAGAAAV